jgi:hypothetical protein
MDLNSALDIIIKDLREAREIIDDMKNVKGVSIIQVELAKSKCKSAEEIIELLKTIEQPTVSVSAAATVNGESEVAASPGPATPAHDLPGSDGMTVPEMLEPESDNITTDIKQEPLMELEDEKEEDAINTEQAEPAEPAEPNMKRVKGKPILADRYGEPYDRVNERMRGTRGDNDISAKLKQSPISNLADAIGVNDRFFYIREVFGGNNQAYYEAINRLNSVTSYREAENIVKDYSSEAGDPAALKSLLDLVRRKTDFNG